jgi:hypothetical protein
VTTTMLLKIKDRSRSQMGDYHDVIENTELVFLYTRRVPNRAVRR